MALAWVLTGACGAGTREGRGDRGGLPLVAALRGGLSGGQQEESAAMRVESARAAAVVTLHDSGPVDASSGKPTVLLRSERGVPPADGIPTTGTRALSQGDSAGGESPGESWGEAEGAEGFGEGFGGADVCIHDNCVRGATHGPQVSPAAPLVPGRLNFF